MLAIHIFTLVDEILYTCFFRIQNLSPLHLMVDIGHDINQMNHPSLLGARKGWWATNLHRRMWVNFVQDKIGFCMNPTVLCMSYLSLIPRNSCAVYSPSYARTWYVRFLKQTLHFYRRKSFTKFMVRVWHTTFQVYHARARVGEWRVFSARNKIRFILYTMLI